MSTYSSQCSAVGSFAYAGYFKLYVELNEKWVSSTDNTSYVDYNVYCQSSGSGSINSNHYKYFSINGEEKINTTENVNASSPNAYIGIASGTIGPIYHNSDGRKTISFRAQIKGSTYGVSATIEDSFQLTHIPRYTTVWNSERGKTVNSISVNWSTADARDWTQYSLNGGAWTDAYDTVDSDNKRGYYTISGLNPNTTYSVKTRCRRTDSGLWSEADAINITTYDIAKITSISDFILGENLTINYSNPSGCEIATAISKTDKATFLCQYRNCSGNSYTYNFTDEELDNLYKLFESSNSVDICIKMRTTCGDRQYYHEPIVTLTLTGNHKTIRVNSEGWKRGKVFVNINGTWKRGVMFKNVSGTWKRGI